MHWGDFSAAIKPIVTINSGDVLVIEDVPPLDPAIVNQSGVVPPSEIPEKDLEQQDHGK